MAESVREVERNRNKKIRLMSENGEFLSASSGKQIVDNSLNNLKSLFYLNNVENNCFSKYSVNNDGVNRASEFCPDVDGFSSEYKGICPNNDENCRKKRCSDRYDSSESSDSGIAVSSSASSGTSDITDPGSPFSTSSEDSSSSPGKVKLGKRCKSEEKSPAWPQPTGRCRSEEKTWTEEWEGKQQSDKTDHDFITPETEFKMAPNVPSASSPCDIWTSITENNTANDTAHFNHFDETQSEAISTKRLKVEAKDSIAPVSANSNNNNNNGGGGNGNKLVVASIPPSPIISETEAEPAENKRKNSGDNCEGAKVKMRRPSHETSRGTKDGPDVSPPKTAKNGAKTSEKSVSVGFVGKSKQDRNRHQGKITEYFKSQIKSLVGLKRDFASKKDSPPGAKSNKPGGGEEPPPKKTKTEDIPSEAPVFVKPSPKPPQTVMPLTTEPSRLISLSNLPKGADFLLKKPAETKTLFNKILQNHKNRKLAESYLKSRTASKPKPAPETEAVSKSGQKPYETSTRNNNVTEMPNTKVEELSSNVEDNKVQNKDLDSNLLKVVSEVTNFEVISKRSEAIESDSSKSPILSTPTTIRFPATGHNRVDKHRPTRESVSCRWDACSVQFDSASGLLEHLQAAHVLTQVSGEKFVCLWVGCKVFDQKSCSRSWLERHVLSHAGNKPYRCIVDGCGQGFSTQAILERHVNNHFAADVKKALDNSIVHKLFRRNGKKLRYRRQPWSARMFDFFDSRIMEGLEHRLVKLTKARTGGDIADIPGKSLALTSQVIARRMTENGRQQFLIRWFPENIVEDEWVYEEEVVRKKTVSIPSLSPAVSSSLRETLDLATRSSRSYRTGRRKNKGTVRPEEVVPVEAKAEPPVDPPPTKTVSDLAPEVPKKPKLSPQKSPTVPAKRTKTKKKSEPEAKSPAETSPLPAVSVSVPVVDATKDGSLTAEKTVSLRPKGETAPVASLPEEMSVVPVCSPAEEVVPVQTGGILVDGTKLIAPLKTEMIVSTPLKLVASQYIEQPFVQAVMPVQMPVTYQIPIVKLSQTSGMFFPQIPNYIIPPQQPVFPASTVPAFRNGFHFSTTGTIQIQASTTTLQHTASSFVQSTNTSGFQIVQSPANVHQSILTAFQNSGMAPANLNLKSPTLRLLNCQPLILNNPKPMGNVSMTLTNVSSIANANASALTVPTVAGLPFDANATGIKGLTTTATTPPASASVAVQTPPAPHPCKATTAASSLPKKLMKQNLNILPKPNLSQKGGVAEGAKSKKQCLQSCGPVAGAAT